MDVSDSKWYSVAHLQWHSWTSNPEHFRSSQGCIYTFFVLGGRFHCTVLPTNYVRVVSTCVTWSHRRTMPSHGETTVDMYLFTHLVLKCATNSYYSYYTYRKAQPTLWLPAILDCNYKEESKVKHINVLSQTLPNLSAPWVWGGEEWGVWGWGTQIVSYMQMSE